MAFLTKKQLIIFAADIMEMIISLFFKVAQIAAAATTMTIAMEWVTEDLDMSKPNATDSFKLEVFCPGPPLPPLAPHYRSNEERPCPLSRKILLPLLHLSS